MAHDVQVATVVTTFDLGTGHWSKGLGLGLGLGLFSCFFPGYSSVFSDQ